MTRMTAAVAAAPPFDRRAIPAGLVLSRWLAPDGWSHRRYDWPSAGSRGSLMFLAGRGDFVEKYVEALAHWHGRGWSVAGFDWRGQGGSGRIVPGMEAGHLASFDPLVDDLAAFAAGWRRSTPGPHVLVGHSMGGHLILRALADGRVEADAAVLAAPMLGLHAPRSARLIAFLAGLFGQTMRPIWAPRDPGVRQRALTASAERFDDALWWKTRSPELGLGVPTWGWLHAAFDSIARLDRPGALERVATPVAIVATVRDRLVSAGAIRRAAARLPQARLAWFDGAHELLRETDETRLAALGEIDRFLAEAAPAS